jgi:hypothetical protein
MLAFSASYFSKPRSYLMLEDPRPPDHPPEAARFSCGFNFEDNPSSEKEAVPKEKEEEEIVFTFT